ncbi:hypothetical protein K8M07_01950 [Schnuerera sp. xch1]|uniref:hypothetical protein n=1 Tax=Schnuerera sp. xch1 TaxID=2874283 RepID=UPI001CBDDA14|nr:hypothetical protein [Schnuerera sp. xch1]MBZ2174018.1 hypothetical protein [Schnuerera sp. xch1]
MNNRVWIVSKVNIRNQKVAYMITLVAFLLMTIPSIIQVLQAGPNEYFEKSYLLSSGNMLYVLLLVSPIFICKTNFTRFMHLNGRKVDYIRGTFLTYVILAVVVSIANHIFYFTLDQSWKETFQVINLIEVFGWINNGVFFSFLQESAFLLLLAIFIHTLTTMHDSWIGWIIDLLLIVLFGLSLTISPFIEIRTWFFNLIIFASNAWIQIIVCLMLILPIYKINKYYLGKKNI